MLELLKSGSPGKGRLATGGALRNTPLVMSTNRSHLQLPPAQVAEFCQRHHIRKLAVFGSALHGDARPDSDLDVLVEFEPGHVPGLFRLTGMELELSTLLGGRTVDLNTPLCLSRHFRDEVLAEAEPVYAAA
jgi:predicted nucleotidyltransferase